MFSDKAFIAGGAMVLGKLPVQGASYKFGLEKGKVLLHLQ